MPIRYANIFIYIYTVHIICEFMGCLSNMSYQSIAWEGWAGLCFFEGARGVLPFRGNLPDCLLMFQGMSKITSKRLQEIPPWKFKSSPLKISLPNRKVVFQPSFFRSYL